MIKALALLVSLTAVVFRADVQDGAPVAGELKSWGPEKVELESEMGLVSLSVPSLVRLEQQYAPESQVPPLPPFPVHVSVELTDGSSLVGTDIRYANNEWIIVREGHPSLTIATRAVRRIRFAPEDGRLSIAWQEASTKEYASDVVLIRVGADKLDFLEGVVQSIDEEQVQFLVDGSPIPVPRRKLSGVVLAAVGAPQDLSVRCEIETSAGEKLRVHECEFKEGWLHVRLASGTSLSLALGDLNRADFSREGLVYLSDLQPDGLEITPFFGQPTSESALDAFIYGYYRSSDPAGNPIALRFGKEHRKQTFAKGISLHSRTQAVFRFDQNFRELRGWVGFDPDARSQSNSDVIIKLGDTVVFQQQFCPQSEPMEIHVPIAGSKRLEILVDYAHDGDFGDRINFGDIRLVP